MNLAGLRAAAEKRLHTIAPDLAFAALAGDTWKVNHRRFTKLQRLPLDPYIAPDDIVELHRMIMPTHNSWDAPGTGNWSLWTRLTVRHVDYCVVFMIPRHGYMPIPTGDFVHAVLMEYVRAPVTG